MKDSINSHKGIIITHNRHSLGGATSMLGAMDLYQRGVPAQKLKLYTQGGPRVGNKAFADYVLSTKIPVTRLINKMDRKHVITPWIMPLCSPCL